MAEQTLFDCATPVKDQGPVDYECIDGTQLYHIPGHPDYAISREGRLWSKRRKSVNSLGYARMIGGMWLNPAPDKDGYMFTCFGKGVKNVYVHKLVALTFIGPPPFDGAPVLHGDDNKLNNSVGNLRYGTNKLNANDAVRNQKMPVGERSGTSRLTPHTVLEIKGRLKEGASLVAVAREFGIGASTVGRIAKRRAWQHVETPNEAMTNAEAFEELSGHQLPFTINSTHQHCTVVLYERSATTPLCASSGETFILAVAGLRQHLPEIRAARLRGPIGN